jgi:membrane-bound ClpP family serine protease
MGKKQREGRRSMWVFAGILLGLVVLASLVGFHAGPHAHLAAGIFGAVAAVTLLIMAIEGTSSELSWLLLGGDLVLSAGAGVLAWRGLSDKGRFSAPHHALSHTGVDGVAVTDLNPEGIVKVRGENWCAVAVNAPVTAGSAVQVVRRGGVRLEVWGEELPTVFGPPAPPVTGEREELAGDEGAMRGKES